MHCTIEPTILSLGTQVALSSTKNPDGKPNPAPMSSAWWLGWTCMLGLGQTSDNLAPTPECVVNSPSARLVSHVGRLALTTGKDPVPEDLLVGAESRPRMHLERWQPLIMSFCRFFHLGGEVHPSRLADSKFMTMMTGGRAA